MKCTIYILTLIYLFLKISTLNNPDDLSSDYPFSLKKGYNEAVIFMEDSIKLFDVSNTASSNPVSSIRTFSCDSGEEKGGIYFKSYYYTSCLINATPNNFRISIYDRNRNIVIHLPIDPPYFTFSTGSIRFFKISSTEEKVGVAWLNGNNFNIYQIDQSGIKNYKIYSVSNIGRDIDCLYINKYQRIVCIFSYKSSATSAHSCQVNIFSESEASFESNTKDLSGCVDHLSRKIRGNTDNNEDSDIFYYYFVGTNGIAYILPLRLTSANSIDRIDSNHAFRYEVMKGCDQSQGSFDFAEDKFLGYNVFSCVESPYSTRIKIQLFKIENGEIIFSNGDIDNPYIFTDKIYPDSERNFNDKFCSSKRYIKFWIFII